MILPPARQPKEAKQFKASPFRHCFDESEAPAKQKAIWMGSCRLTHAEERERTRRSMFMCASLRTRDLDSGVERDRKGQDGHANLPYSALRKHM